MKQRVNILKGSEYFPYPLYVLLHSSDSSNYSSDYSVSSLLLSSEKHDSPNLMVVCSFTSWSDSAPSQAKETIKIKIKTLGSAGKCIATKIHIWLFSWAHEDYKHEMTFWKMMLCCRPSALNLSSAMCVKFVIRPSTLWPVQSILGGCNTVLCYPCLT